MSTAASPLSPSAARRVTVRGGAIEVHQLDKSYGPLKVVDDVSFNVAEGEFFALLGPSGSGKTTLLMTLAGFESPNAGRIAIDGRDVTWLPPNKRDIGMVFQKYALFPHLTVRDNVAFPLRMRGVPKEARHRKADEALDTVGLTDLGHRLPAQLSGGQQQRVALARAIVYQPPLLLMDEPLGALDKKLRERMQSEIKHLQRALGATVIYVTHDQEEALTMADRIAVLNRGKLVQVGTPDELYNRPRSRFVANFIGETNFLAATLVGQTDGRGQLQLADGTMVMASAGETLAKPGDAVHISLRPEGFTVTPGTGEGLTGRVEEIIFAGATRLLTVRPTHGPQDQPLITIRQAASTPPPQMGETVTLTWQPDAALFFGEDGQ
ncbi:ABC transporter ATP-binding protein [Elstera sp.]|jgi:spermidine/putrescine ABC transporter ATP-binding subunit|uniref:ABC transporter ATP-binding protein n=1 Tax=Elstera sp. TaxID=1916664 RepID=UPI0037BE9E1E